MTELKITDEFLLNEKAKRVIFDGSVDIVSISNALQDLRFKIGVPWLTAQQAGINLRILVVGGIQNPIINPNIITYSDDLVTMPEGNASNKKVFNVKRPDVIRVRYYDHTGTPSMHDYSGLTSRVIQQAFDLMEGNGLYSRVSKLKIEMAEKRIKKMEKKGVR